MTFTITVKPTYTFTPFLTITPVSIYPTSLPPSYCCKHCSTGKPCGDSCISRSYTCHKPPGCACY
jgi:hypothetical protein